MTDASNTADPDRYTYQVVWSEDDSEYVATVAEFPSLSWLADTRRDAEDGLVSLVGDVLTDMTASGEALPTPLGQRTYSGKFNLRIPPALHRDLAMEAAREGVSLNQLATLKLARR